MNQVQVPESNILLRPLHFDDGRYIYNWVQDKEVVLYSLSKWQNRYTREEFNVWYKNTLTDKSNINFAIVLKDSKKIIGYAGFCSIDKSLGKAEYFIFIGNKKEWGKGYGTQTTKRIVDYGFKKLTLKSITLTVSEPNIAGIKAYLKSGFEITGRIKNSTLRDGKYHDKIIMELQNKFI